MPGIAQGSIISNFHRRLTAMSFSTICVLLWMMQIFWCTHLNLERLRIFFCFVCMI